jgi:hypothetical protein
VWCGAQATASRMSALPLTPHRRLRMSVGNAYGVPRTRSATERGCPRDDRASLDRQGTVNERAVSSRTPFLNHAGSFACRYSEVLMNGWVTAFGGIVCLSIF